MNDATVAFGPYVLDLRRSVLTKNGQLAPLRGRSLEILCALARAGSEPVAKDELLTRIWPGASVGENNLHVHISDLRKFLGEAGKAYLVTVPGFGYQLLASETVAAPPQASGGRPTLAVMAFRSLSGGGAAQNFADGLTEELITQLARCRSLCVVTGGPSRLSESDARRTARRIGTRYLLEGSVHYDLDRALINARLIDLESGSYLWANRYQRAVVDSHLVQDEIANAVAAAIDVLVIAADQQRILNKSSDNLRAWEAYERGLWHFGQCGIEENEKARNYLQQAIKLEPHLSKAYQWMVYVYVQDGLHYRTSPIEKARACAEELAMKALALDPTDAGAHAALGFVAQMENNLPAALAKAEEALAINPNDGDALRLKGACQLGLALGDEGAQTLRYSVRLRPNDPLNWRAPHHLCWYSYVVEDYAGAIEAGRAALRANSNQCLTHAWLASSLGRLGRIEEARNIIARLSRQISPLSLDDHVCRRLPWIPDEAHARMLDGLRKTGWRGRCPTEARQRIRRPWR
jgi:adenylate cyclase